MDIVPKTKPDPLLVRIMRRFGLERQLARIRRILGTSIAFFCIAFVATLAALVVLRAALSRSSFLSYARLIRSDFHFVIGHPGSFAFAIFESAPAAFIALVLVGVALLLLCLRVVVEYRHRMSSVSTSIRNN